MNADFDIAIVGGGMVGASLALALADTPFTVALIEAVAPDSNAQPSFDERTTALGNGSRRIFQALGVWDEIARSAAAIRSIHVSDAGRFGFARLDAREHGIEAFGYVAPNRVIGAALWNQLGRHALRITLCVPARPLAIEIQAGQVLLRLDSQQRPTDSRRDRLPEQISARLVVAADGARSRVREVAGIDVRVEDYGQVAVVASVATDQPHGGAAYERFTASGPLALLPLHDGGRTVVWTLAPPDAAQVLRLSDAEFLQRLQARFGWRAGRFTRAGRRASYPLQLVRAAHTVGRRAVLVGNAAQALHPVAGQGFNLGLRDAAMLAEVLALAAAHPGERDPGDARVLAQFADWRGADRRGVTGFTDGLVKLFGSRWPGVGLARDTGLLLFDLSRTAKSALARVSIGFGGRTPRLARGLGLQ